jgi:epoxide hydrolase 4
MMKHRFADTGDVRLHYVEAGRGNVVIFLHGFPEFWYMWKAQLEHFGADHHAVAPDMRGYNLSSKPRNDSAYRAETVAADVIALADTLGAERFTLVGHDWGGVVAWHVATLYPDRLDRLVIINAPHPAVMARELSRNPAQMMASSYVLFLRTPGADRVLTAFNFAILRRGFLRRGLEAGYFSEPDIDAYIAAWSEPGAIRGGIAYYRAPGFMELLRRFRERKESTAKIPVNTLVIWGEQDPYLLEGNLDGLDELVDDIVIERVPDASHWIVHEQPENVNRLIRNFIAGAAGPRQA